MKPRTAPTASAFLAVMVLSMVTLYAGSKAEDQFQSVIFVRKAGAEADMYEKLRPHSLAMIYPSDFYDWGGKYMYMWYFPHLISNRDDTPGDPNDLKTFKADPRSVTWCISRGLWENWDRYRAAGILTGKRPEHFEDLWIVSKKYALAKRDGKPLPNRLEIPYKNRQMGPICFANPDAVQAMVDLAKFNAAHLWNRQNREDRYMPVNSAFIDLDGLQGCQMDFSEFARAGFEKWVRANYKPEEIKAIFQVDPSEPIQLLPPKGASPEVVNRYHRMQLEFYQNTLLANYCHTLKKAVDSVLGPGKFHFVYHGEGYWWRVLGGNIHNVTFWGDWVDSYCCECAVTPYVKRGTCYYALPDIIPYRNHDMYHNMDNSNNVYDYQYGAGRLWGEPVVVKTGYKGQPVGRSPASASLALAEGLALLGNMRLDAAKENSSGVKSVPASYALPMVGFMHKLTPQIRQMIPSAQVGVLYSPADTWLFKGFEKPSNDTQAFQVSNILQCQHVPLQVVHLQLLERTLAERPVKVLIVPWVRCLKDSQVKVLENYVRNGGNLVFIGECGTLTWEGVKRKSNAFSNLQPTAEPGKVTFGKVGKGQVAYIPGMLDEKTDSAKMLQQALFTVLGHAASCVRPDRSPLLLTNLTRNSDKSCFWMHLLNYAVDHSEKELAKAVSPLRDVRVVIPLPNHLKAKAVHLYRFDGDDLTLAPEQGREGCAVTVPEVGIYALIRVETEPGDRPQNTLLQPTEIKPYLEMVENGFRPGSSGKTLSKPSGPLADVSRDVLRGLSSRPIIAYFAGVDGKPVTIEYQRKNTTGNPDIAIYDRDGKTVKPVSRETKSGTVLTVPAQAGGNYYSMVMNPKAKQCALSFPDAAGACFEASLTSPLTLEEEGDSAPLYFYVPKGCKTFKISANTRPFWTPHLQPVHMTVKDDKGALQFEHNGPIDGGWTWERSDKNQKVFTVKVPEHRDGQVWSLNLLDAKGKKEKKKFVQICLEGVPPVVASTPKQLLIAGGDK